MKPRNHNINLICRFCGSVTPEKWFDDIKQKYINMCNNCSISTTSRKGKKVRYAAAVRDYSSAFYADNHPNKPLTRGEVYVVSSTKPWIHGCYVYLEGFGNQVFDIKIFTPETYETFSERGRAYPQIPKGFLPIGGEDRISEADQIWYSDRQKFDSPNVIHIDDLATNHHLVIRKEKR